jgi:hypothetical protein
MASRRGAANTRANIIYGTTLTPESPTRTAGRSIGRGRGRTAPRTRYTTIVSRLGG